MTHTIRRFTAALVASMAFAMPASATNFSTDWTDLWFNPAESGWGINIIQQGATLFATIFVYEADRQPHWFVASEMNGGPTGFSGPLYQVSGPHYAGPWGATSPATAVGNIALTFSTANSATLQYSVGGITVTKAIQRQSFRANNLGGAYYGGLVAVTNCTPREAAAQGPYSVTHSGASVAITLLNASTGAVTCSFNGTYSAQGRLGTLNGTSSCLGIPGTFSMTELDVSKNGWNSVFAMSDTNGCNFNGYFGGTRDQR